MANISSPGLGPMNPGLAGTVYPSNKVNITPNANPYIPTGSNTIGAQTVRATGGGAGDAQWRQNLATFSGGQFARPGGMLSFNPLSNNPFGGAPTGGGNAPAMGMPSTLLQLSLGMNPMTMGAGSSTTPSTTPTQSTPSNQSTINSIDDWLSQYMSQGNLFGQPQPFGQPSVSPAGQ